MLLRFARLITPKQMAAAAVAAAIASAAAGLNDIVVHGPTPITNGTQVARTVS